ncbi:MAG: hypothetical protein AB8C84_04885 [Oligoflexales bacterium]
MMSEVENNSEIVEENSFVARRVKPTKMRLELYEDDQSGLGRFLCELKRRHIKDVDLPELILEALEAVPEEWWAEKLKEMTPLEYRVQTALEDPTMRERLEALLQEGEKARSSH